MIRIDCEEDGFWLTVEDDEDTGGPTWLGYRLRLTDPDQLFNLVKDVIGPWIDARNDAKAEWEASKRYGENPDENFGYALDDPKHPTFHDRMSEHYDSRSGK